jgi:predicted alpha/beta-hydrolase family hydrolase
MALSTAVVLLLLDGIDDRLIPIHRPNWAIVMAFSAYEKNGVVGFLHASASKCHAAMVLTHGAGSDCSSPLLIATAAAFSAAGITVLRCDLQFRQKSSRGPPPRASAAEDRRGLKLAVDQLRAIVGTEVFLAGHSYGGRQASILLAEQPGVAAALLLMSYPLHPPQKPLQLRTQHFPALTKRAVFVHGINDPFGTLEELRHAVALISAPTEIISVQNAGHDLLRGRFDFGPVVGAFSGP